jgi:L-Ala-D/L-Glu epimerase
MRKLDVTIERLPFAAPFRIAGYLFEALDVVIVALDEGAHRGRGEAAGVYYLGDTAPGMAAAIERVRAALEAGADRAALEELLPPGGARNAVDCALWELEAMRAQTPVWRLAGLARPRPLLTTFTLGADAPAAMADAARRLGGARALKLKLTGELALDLERVRAVRGVRPDVWLGVDANQGYEASLLGPLIEALAIERVELLEQPLKRGREADLEGLTSPIAIAADESALTRADLAGLVGRFNVVNIKLDKCGGLTEGLAMAREARRLGLKVMVGNMVGTSLAMAPAFLVGQLCDIVDLDGPTFLAQDRAPSIVYRDGAVWCEGQVWGGAYEGTHD